ncbi:VRR-NUC domain-containing protein [uncultured Arsenicicoccus sp.]|uniref:VRR-NUC domain-containing protein n=1 Tax=uncultured Arsenicicoccus sp. TaxID=491339 RepID=UPI002599FE09|nr:VRR-NUC domain-containing protein [uncultured Arsenicicoccus sp.]
MTARDMLAAGMTEDQLQRAVQERATRHGWRWHHETDSRRSNAGLPDLVMVHPVQRRIAFWELKRQSPRAKATDEQRAWLDDAAAAGAEAAIIRPIDLLDGTVDAMLAQRPNHL